VCPLSAVVKVGKGHTRQALTQIGTLVGIGNRIQTNQKASSGTSTHMVSDGNVTGDQTKSTIQFSSASEDLGRDW
jgi:hypothetical protein